MNVKSLIRSTFVSILGIQIIKNMFITPALLLYDNDKLTELLCAELSKGDQNTFNVSINPKHKSKIELTKLCAWNVDRMRLRLPLPSTVNERQFTIVILTFDRAKSLVDSLNHYGRFRNVRRILVIWNDVNTTIPQHLFGRPTTYKVPVVFIQAETNRLRNRFMQRKEIDTQGRIQKLIIKTSNLSEM
jgi:hypothetical protein